LADSAAQIATPLPRPLVRVERYGRYQLLERIGKGGMAEIFRAVSGGIEGWSRLFVIKRIRPEKSQSREFIRMFCEEARLCAMLHHPNIVQVYDFGQINGSYFLAMEYLRGKDLSTVMRAVRAEHTAIAPSTAAFIAQQAAVGLHHAHTLVDGNRQPVRIVHRDVTPSNIMLLRTGAVKILDFGIAKDVGQGETEIAETDAGQVKGKLAYLSPEQVRAQPLDGRSDVFALGVVLWEMLTGQRLFSADSEFQTMRNVLMMAVPPPSSVRAGIPAGLDAIVARALERDRERRYSAAAAMAADLEQVVHTERFVGQAIPQLLERLFGEEPSMVTPAPDDKYLNAEPSDVVIAKAPVPRSKSSSDGSRSSLDDRLNSRLNDQRIPQGIGPAGPSGEVSLEIFAAEEVPILVKAGALGRWLRGRRQRTTVAAAGATLVLGLAFGAWRGSRASLPALDPVEHAAASAAVAPDVLAPIPSSVDLLVPPLQSLRTPASRHAAAAAAPPARLKTVRRHQRPLANDLTIDPFR
jgi:serine/threonine-protein kinase